MVYCKFCGAGYVFVSKAKDETINYCGECGEDWREKRDVEIEQWNELLQQKNQKKLANSGKRR